jgi:beta-lactam-binding protein with PASTA domain
LDEAPRVISDAGLEVTIQAVQNENVQSGIVYDESPTPEATVDVTSGPWLQHRWPVTQDDR